MDCEEAALVAAIKKAERFTEMRHRDFVEAYAKARELETRLERLREDNKRKAERELTQPTPNGMKLVRYDSK